MESFIGKYINNRNGYLYIYTNDRSVCNNSNDGCGGYATGNTNVHTDRAIVSKLNSTIAANNIT